MEELGRAYKHQIYFFVCHIIFLIVEFKILPIKFFTCWSFGNYDDDIKKVTVI